LKHGGKTILANLAYACPFCNNFKGTDIGTYLGDEQLFVRLYNPRIDTWTDHFFLSGIIIEPLTQIGEATIKILSLNEEKRLIERSILSEISRYPEIGFEKIINH
ncbi:MAG: HNH endonuclease, partial [Bacteroidota bacterium]